MTGTGRVLHCYLPAAALFVALIVAWQLAVTVFRLREYLLPAPLSVVRAMMGDEIPWIRHLWITSIEIVGAFLVAGVVGVALGSRWRGRRSCREPWCRSWCSSTPFPRWQWPRSFSSSWATACCPTC